MRCQRLQLTSPCRYIRRHPWLPIPNHWRPTNTIFDRHQGSLSTLKKQSVTLEIKYIRIGKSKFRPFGPILGSQRHPFYEKASQPPPPRGGV
jgi:hypothetical protein